MLNLNFTASRMLIFFLFNKQKKLEVIQGTLYVNGIVGRDTRELCQMDPFVIAQQSV